MGLMGQLVRKGREILPDLATAAGCRDASEHSAPFLEGRRVMVTGLSVVALLGVLCSAQADVLFGLKTRFGVLMSSDGTVRAKSSLIIQQNHDWMYRLGKRTVLGVRGHAADARVVAAKLQSVCSLHELEHGCEMPARAVSRYARHVLSNGNIDALIASCAAPDGVMSEEHALIDQRDGELYWVHRSGLWYPVDYAAHGEEARMLWSLLDRRYSKDLRFEEALQLVQDCWDAVRTRSPRNLPGIKTVLVGASGQRELDVAAELSRQGAAAATVSAAR